MYVDSEDVNNARVVLVLFLHTHISCPWIYHVVQNPITDWLLKKGKYTDQSIARTWTQLLVKMNIQAGMVQGSLAMAMTMGNAIFSRI